MADSRHVFISHSSKDRSRAEEIDAILRNWGVKTWMAPRDISSGGTFAGQITKAVDRCAAMIVIVTPAAYKSTFVHVEVERAFQKKKRLYPVRFEAVKPAGDIELYLSAFQWIDAFEPDRDEALERLAHDLGGRSQQGGESSPSPASSILPKTPPPASPPPPTTRDVNLISVSPPSTPPPPRIELASVAVPSPPPPHQPSLAMIVESSENEGGPWSARLVTAIAVAGLGFLIFVGFPGGRIETVTTNNTVVTWETDNANTAVEDTMTGYDEASNGIENTVVTNTTD